MEFQLKSVERFNRGRTDKQPRKKTRQRVLKKLHKKFFRADQIIIETAEPLAIPKEICSLLLRQNRQGFSIGLVYRDGTTEVLV